MATLPDRLTDVTTLSPELAEMARGLAQSLTMGVAGHDQQAVSERMARATQLVGSESLTADAAYARAAAAQSLAEPTTRQTLGSLVVCGAGGDLYRAVSHPESRSRLVTEVLDELEEWGTVLIDDEDGIRYDFVPHTEEGRRDAELVVQEVERLLQDSGAVPVLDDRQLAAAAELSERVKAVTEPVAGRRDTRVLEPFYDPASRTATASVTLMPQTSFVDPVITVTVTAAQESEGVTLAIDGGSATGSMSVADAAGVLSRTREAQGADVTVYTTPGCVGCAATRRQLDRAGVAYELVDLSTRPDLVARFRAEGLAQAPVIESADGRRTSGFDPGRIKAIVAAASSPAPATAPTARGTAGGEEGVVGSVPVRQQPGLGMGQ